MIIKNGLINDAVNKDAYVADILIENGKIKAIGKIRLVKKHCFAV